MLGDCEDILVVAGRYIAETVMPLILAVEQPAIKPETAAPVWPSAIRASQPLAVTKMPLDVPRRGPS